MAFCSMMAQSQTWIWYPGDYEIWLGNQMNNKRTERGAFFPHFWKMDSHYVLIEFNKNLDLAEPEEIDIVVEGVYNVKLDGKLQFGQPRKMLIPAGRHVLNIKVYNQLTPPTIYVNGKTIFSDSSWRVTNEDKEWIDESGKASDTSATFYMDAACWNFNSADDKPSQFKLTTTPMQAVSREKYGEGELIDFGKETFGFIHLHGLNGNGQLRVFYGESAEEALAVETGETLDILHIQGGNVTDLSTHESRVASGGDYLLDNSKAFRYVYVTKDLGVSYSDVSMLYEYLPLEYRGTFRCDDEEINRIWDVGAYTMHLTSREFFIDGIKRDRWVWSGDAIQSYLMNYYLFFDNESVKRTIWLLRGKDPITSHLNTILDYTFFWFLSVYDYYLYSGDAHFVKQLYPRMRSLMDYVLSRTNENGMVEGLTGDWVFVDWADGPMDKRGELSYEQVLFCKSLETMALCAQVAEVEEDRLIYTDLASSLQQKLIPTFWDEGKQALVHNRVNGISDGVVTRYSNMFASFFNYLDNNQKQAIKKSVLLNDEVMKITTPYMRFYELEALCTMGEFKTVTAEMKDYWGGMLREGATSFWEKYNPEEKGEEHLSMYGRPFGKSLCHAWGASPIYLLGKYYLGVKPIKEGYKEFAIQPSLGGLKWMEGSVPTPYGEIKLFMNARTIKVKSDGGNGYLHFESKSKPSATNGTLEHVTNNTYRIWIDTTEEIVVSYK